MESIIDERRPLKETTNVLHIELIDDVFSDFGAQLFPREILSWLAIRKQLR